MLRARFLILPLALAALTMMAVWPSRSRSATALRRVTTTSEESINLNPSISGDGQRIAFESIADLAGVRGAFGFRALLVDITSEESKYSQVGLGRIIAPALSRDGSLVAFASNEDLVGSNFDRNSEIFLYNGSSVRQISNTVPGGIDSRIQDGNFQPSITNDGRLIAFSSNRDLVGLNRDLNFEVFLCDSVTTTCIQITSTQDMIGSTDAKISGDGSHVAFIRDVGRSRSRLRDLMLYNRLSNNTTTLVDQSAGLVLCYGRAISNDGYRVVYSSETAENQTQVFFFDLRAKNPRQVTSLGSRTEDVPLNATISGDGQRLTFATRRKVVSGSNDSGVELYLYDIPTGHFLQVTNAPSAATAEVVSSLNDDGTILAFSFPRILSGPVSTNELANNSEIYVAEVAPREAFGTLSVLNAASLGNEPRVNKSIAPASLVLARGNALASAISETQRLPDGLFPVSLERTRVDVNGKPAQILYVSPNQVNFIVPATLDPGEGEVIITNSDGFPSKSAITITSAAPGIFSVAGDGRGEGLTLNADSLLPGPFDPTQNSLRLIVFCTGLHNSKNLSARIAGIPVTVESVVNSDSLPGLDEVHLLVPSNLRGAGISDLFLSADDYDSNPVTITLVGSPQRDIVINEVLADPPEGAAGDANHDGSRDSSQDEFIELVNTTTRDLDLSGYELLTSGAATDVTRHKFAAGTVLSAGTAIVVFGGGTTNALNSTFGGALVFKASTGGLSLLNAGGVVSLRDASGQLITSLSYGNSIGLRGDANQSLTRSPDISGTFTLHQSAPGSNGALFSPGTHLNGEPFLAHPAISQIVISPPSAILHPGEELQLTARAFAQDQSEAEGIIFRWESNDLSTLAIDKNGSAKAIRAGTAEVTASARGVKSAASVVNVQTVSPTPTPAISPTPSPTATPSPNPLPSPSPGIVISEFRTRGPNGANDEFIELYNNNELPVEIGGWKIRGSSNTGTVTTRMTITPGTLIPPRGHFLAANSAGYSASIPPDQSYTSGISNDGGIALTLANDAVVDAVGLSSGSVFNEGTNLARLPSDANQSYERKPGGLSGGTQDTGDNFADFQLLTPSDPQNLHSNATPSASPTPSPSVTPPPSPSPSPTPSASPAIKVVISQIYGGGGNSGAPFRNDFVEIFNAGTNTANLGGWSIQYSGATSISWAATPLGEAVLLPGHYLLIQESSGGTAGGNLPAPDVAGSVAMAASAGKVALASSQVLLTGACPTDQTIVDLVGYGTTATCFQGGAPTTAPSNIVSVLRKGGGCSQTLDNLADFVTGPPNPRNSMTPSNGCSVNLGSQITSTVLPNDRYAQKQAINILEKLCRDWSTPN